MDIELREAAEAALGYRFRDESLLAKALTHASVAELRVESNERLEFLGDAILGHIACEMIYRAYPDLLEGEMTKIKSSTVSRRTCARIAHSLGIDSMLSLGKGMRRNAVLPSSLAACVLEAVIAAIYLDGGWEATRGWLEPLIGPHIDRAERSGHQHNFKSVLQQHAQQLSGQTPCYRILDEQGPDHAKAFKIVAEIGGRRFEPSWGQSKKQAEQQAAFNALEELGVIEEGEDGEVRVVDDGEE